MQFSICSRKAYKKNFVLAQLAGPTKSSPFPFILHIRNSKLAKMLPRSSMEDIPQSQPMTQTPAGGAPLAGHTAPDRAPPPARDEPPTREDTEERINAATHAAGFLLALAGGAILVTIALPQSPGLTFACTAYMLSVALTFACSTLSHVIKSQPALDRMRAWDQAMIYAMISGTYTPIIFVHTTDNVRTPLLSIIWLAAGIGIASKLLLGHRINNIRTPSYLLLGWLPSLPLIQQVPSQLAWLMLAGGVLYTIGVVLLLNDHRVKYLHAGWHFAVIAAACCHFAGIYFYVVQYS